METQVVTRFAPSPTGYLHIGGLRTALFNYLYARKMKGKFLLRIEDTDLSRNSQDAKEAILKAFEWVGLDWDGEVLYQSQRFGIYKRYINQLLSEKKAYYCYVSKEELQELRESQRQRGQTPRYDNRYRDFEGTPPSGIEPVVRIKAPLSGEICFVDGIKGKMRIQAKEIDDFIIARSDGSPTYNFVVAIDDALMGVSDVIRGDDHLSNTPKQIIIYQALNLKIPNFFHVPMILNPKGHKLSKRDGAMGVMDYKALGYLPEALLNFLVRLGWSHGDEEIFSLQDMLTFFDPKDINAAPSAYNQEKFLWLNSHYLQQLPNKTLASLLEDFGVRALEPAQEWLFDEIKTRAKTLRECAHLFNECMGEVSYDEGMRAKVQNEQNCKLLAQFAHFLEHQEEFQDSAQLECLLNDFAKENQIKPKQLFMPLRYALLGKSGGVGLVALMLALQKNTTIVRIQKALACLKD